MSGADLREASPATAGHYGRGDVASVTAALARAGLGGEKLACEVVAPLDQFHVGGLSATRSFAERLVIGPDTRVLDLGCGLGGPARYLAATFGCAVVGIDLSPAFIEIGVELTRRTGLTDRVVHRLGNATDLPFGPAEFDLVWTQHVAMNIVDRDRLYTEIVRVLRPGGRLAAYDVVAGEAGLPHLPAPWARDAAQSFVVTPEAMRSAIERAGLVVDEWRDVTEMGLTALRAQAAAAQAGMPGGLSLALVMGPDFPALAANLARSLSEGRARLVQVVASKPA